MSTRDERPVWHAERVVECGIRLMPVYRVWCEDPAVAMRVRCASCGGVQPWAGYRTAGRASHADVEHLCAACLENELASDAAHRLLLV